MDIGTGKITKRQQKLVPHHLLDVISPKRQLTVADYKRLLKRAIAQIRRKGKLPFLVGGSAFYIYAVIDDWKIPEIKPNLKLRKQLEGKSTQQLFQMLKKLDPRRAQTIDRHNPRRLIRALEITKATGQPVPYYTYQTYYPYDLLILGIKKGPQELKKLIKQRLENRLRAGMVAEVKRLKRQGLSFKRLESFGLEYRLIAEYLQGKLNYDEMVAKLKTAIWRFSKRQMTWFKRDRRIKWIKNQKQAEKLTKAYLSTKA